MADLDGTTFLTGANAGFIAELYARFLKDPNSVDESWRRFFSDMGDDLSTVLTERRGPAWSKPTLGTAADGAAPVTEFGAEALRQAAIDSICALNLIRAYRVRGHLEADLDPPASKNAGPTPSSTTTATVLPRPISTVRSSSTTCSVASAPPWARSSRC